MILRLKYLRPKKHFGDKLFMHMKHNTPSLIAWAKDGGPQPHLIRGLATAFGVKREVILALLCDEVDYTVEGGEVVFNWPGDDPMIEEVK
jgi:hypothetical protein